MTLHSPATEIRIGQSSANDPAAAVDEFFHAVHQPQAAVVIFFCSPDYDRDTLAAELNRRFIGTPVIGCTTAGEIGPAGYLTGSLTGFSLPAAHFKVATGLLTDLHDFRTESGRGLTRNLLQTLDDSPIISARRFAFLMIDGLSIREEIVARSLQVELGNTPLLGGSAGDGMAFEKTWVFSEGAFHTDAALLSLIETALPFHTFKTQHFVCEDERLVVTEADATLRIVREINGLPAAEEYARVVGATVEHLSPAHFAASPVVVVIDGTDYVRSIQKVNPDGSLTFFSAIDEGLVLRVARGEHLVENLASTLAEENERVGGTQLLLACDCILRTQELTSRGLKETVGNVFKRYNTIGFSTYGEQFGGVHINQTLTGIAIGR